MAEEITGIRYRWGLAKNVSGLDTLPSIDLRQDDIPADVRALVSKEGVLDLGGTRGDPSVGSPIEVDDLVVDTSVRQVRIRVYNRGIQMITTEDEELTRIHRVCCSLQKLLPSSRAPGV